MTMTKANPHAALAEYVVPLSFYEWLATVEKDVRVHDLMPQEITCLAAALRTQPPADTDGLVERLLRKAYRREIWHEPDGAMDAPCDEDDYGAEEYFVNPDGPEAATTLTAARAHIEALLRVVDEGREALTVAGHKLEAVFLRASENDAFDEAIEYRAWARDVETYLSTDKPEVREAAAFVKGEG
jgi:hypothetical protein